MNPTAPQALFFDFDGVLVDSVKIKTIAFKKLFQPFGEDVVAQIIEYHRLHGGISRVEKIRYGYEEVMKIPLSKEQHCELSRQYSKLVEEEVIRANWIAGAEQFLQYCPAELPVFVISGTPEDELKRVVQARKMNQYFREILGSPTRKPSHIQVLLSRYNLQPGTCVFIGDAMTDYDAARETGLQFIGIQGDIIFPPGTTVLQDCCTLKEAIRKKFHKG